MKRIASWGGATVAAVIGVMLAGGAEARREAAPQDRESPSTGTRGQQPLAESLQTTAGWVK